MSPKVQIKANQNSWTALTYIFKNSCFSKIFEIACKIKGKLLIIIHASQNCLFLKQFYFIQI